MKPLLSTFAILTLCLTPGCADQPLRHDYEGDVHLRWLEVNVQPLELHEGEAGGDFAKITKAQRVWQRLEEMMNPAKRQQLDQQLREFQQIIVDGVREASGIPLVASEDIVIQPTYDETGQLTRISFEYPLEDGAYMNLSANVYYSGTSSGSFGAAGANQSSITVRPRLNLQINGYTAGRDLFWRYSQVYESNKTYQFGNQFIFGVSLEKIETSEIFLIPLARGVSDELQKKARQGAF